MQIILIHLPLSLLCDGVYMSHVLAGCFPEGLRFLTPQRIQNSRMVTAHQRTYCILVVSAVS